MPIYVLYKLETALLLRICFVAIYTYCGALFEFGSDAQFTKMSEMDLNRCWLAFKTFRLSKWKYLYDTLRHFRSNN